MENKDGTPKEAKDYYSRSIWWSETSQAFEDYKNSVRNGTYSFQEIMTPEISETFGDLKSLTSNIRRVDEIVSDTGSDENGKFVVPYSIQILSTEIVEIVEDGKSITINKDRRVDDLYVAVGEDDLDVVKWALDHAVSPGARIFLVHVSPPITLIPTPVGMFERNQLTPQQVRRYLNEVNNKRKDLLQNYIQLSNEAKVTADTLILESKHKGKAILDLISILNITNLVLGIKKLPCKRGNDKLSEGEFVKKNAPKTCDVTLIYNGNVLVSDACLGEFPYYGSLSQNKDHSKRSFFHQCICFSGCVGEEKEN
ncbi:uncharacterized protein LOC131628030 [Vicia villosa]|uniref:uncharacterized protein LOC131628030 n=1 Tax=Vicia villosa TaxID=3911 RepID=UPI00273B210F|nr:uncharacterized protein LOC131628030 [Vicia villosa]